MASDRVQMARTIIESQLQSRSPERISSTYKGDQEAGDWHTFPIEADDLVRAGDLALSIVAALGKGGFTSTGGPATAKWTGKEAWATFDIRVAVGGVKSL